jgi:hypothetical protein
MSQDNKWSKPSNPPPPLFLGEKERNLVKQVNDELLERVIGQQILYLPVSVEYSTFHPLYGEAIEKVFIPPVRIYTLVEFDGIKTTTENFGLDKEDSIIVRFHKRRLTEDQDLYLREGDYVMYGQRFYEIVSLTEDRQLFGQIDSLFQFAAKCIRTRRGIIDLEVDSTALVSAQAAASLVDGGDDGGGDSGGDDDGGAAAANVVFQIPDTTSPGVLDTDIAAGSSINDLFGITGELDHTTIMVFVNGILQTVSESAGVSDFQIVDGEIISNFTLTAGSTFTVVFLTALSGVFGI